MIAYAFLAVLTFLMDCKMYGKQITSTETLVFLPCVFLTLTTSSLAKQSALRYMCHDDPDIEIGTASGVRGSASMEVARKKRATVATLGEGGTVVPEVEEEDEEEVEHKLYRVLQQIGSGAALTSPLQRPPNVSATPGVSTLGPLDYELVEPNAEPQYQQRMAGTAVQKSGGSPRKGDNAKSPRDIVEPKSPRPKEWT